MPGNVRFRLWIQPNADDERSTQIWLAPATAGGSLEQLHTALFHPAQGDIIRHYARGTAAISNHLYFITIAHQAQRRIDRADVIGDPGDDQFLRPVALTAEAKFSSSMALTINNISGYELVRGCLLIQWESNAC